MENTGNVSAIGAGAIAITSTVDSFKMRDTTRKVMPSFTRMSVNRWLAFRGRDKALRTKNTSESKSINAFAHGGFTLSEYKTNDHAELTDIDYK